MAMGWREQRTPEEPPRYHTVGIGAGPANLSLAALYRKVSNERLALFEARSRASWRSAAGKAALRPAGPPGRDGTEDLVRVVDPRHQLTFLNYLVTSGRLHALMNSHFDTLPRTEYERYLSWATERLGVVRFGVGIDRISITDDGFRIFSNGLPVAVARHLVLGLGTRTVRPAYVTGLPRERVFTADDLGSRLPGLRGHRAAPIAVAGSGQASVACVLRLLEAGFTDIRWIDREQRRRSAGVVRGSRDLPSASSLRAMYEADYDAMRDLGRYPVTLLPGRLVSSVRPTPEGNLRLYCSGWSTCEVYDVRHLVVAAGRESVPVPFDDDLRERIDLDHHGEPVVGPDYSVRARGLHGHRMFSFTAGPRSGPGRPDQLRPQIRAAIMVNSIFDEELYAVSDRSYALRP